MKKLRPLVLLLFMVLLISIGLATAASNEVPVTGLGETSATKNPNQFAPPECARMELRNIVVGDDGTGDNDLILGTSSSDTIHGHGRNDCILGGAGNDELYGEGGNDVLLGGPGDDYLNGGGGNDICWGGDGNDQFDNCDEIHDP